MDDICFEVMNRNEACRCCRLGGYCFGRGGDVVTTTKGMGDWHEPLSSDEVMAAASFDRLPPHSRVLNIKGGNYWL